MTEQEKIISDFEKKCEEMTSGNTNGKLAKENLSDEMNGIINKHSNMPNINENELKEGLQKVLENYQSKLRHL